MGLEVTQRHKSVPPTAVVTEPPFLASGKKRKDGPDTFGFFTPQLPRSASGSRSRIVKISGPTTILCAACSKENTLQAHDTGYHYCAHCGYALNINHKESHLTHSPQVALGFLKFEGIIKDTPQNTAKSLAALREIISEAAQSFGGFAKIMGDKALLAFGLKPGSSPELETQRLLAAVQQIKSQTSLNIYAGLHVGDVTSGILGVTGEKWFDLLGSPVNYAARILSANKQGSPLLISEAFRNVMSPLWLQLGEPDRFNLKGFDGPQVLVPAVIEDRPFGNTDSLRVKDLQINHCEHTHDTAFCPYCGNAHSLQAQKENETPQNRNIFILSIDIAGFSTAAASMDKKDIARWIVEFYSHVEPVIARHHGVIIGRNADEVLVRFGAPSQGNTALHAFSAAFELKLALKSQQKRPLIKPIAFRIGIAQAMAFVEGKTTVGDVVEKAQEVQSKAPLNGISIETSLVPQARVFSTTASAASDQGIAILTQRKTNTIRLAQQKAAALPLIGRLQQLALVKDNFDKAKKGESQTLILRGFDGSGRHSVILQLLAENQEQVIDLNGDVNSWLQDPLKAAFRNLFSRMQVLGTDWHKLLTFVRMVNPIETGEIPEGFEDSDNYMATLLGRYMGFQLGGYKVSEGLKNLRANPSLLEKKTQAVVTHFLRKLSEIKPVVLVLNHLDQAEPEAKKFLGAILEQLKENKLLTLATMAPDSDAEPLSLPHKTEIEFPYFDLAHTATLMSYVIADQIIDAKKGGSLPQTDPLVTSAVFNETAGQPLHIIELTRSYLAKGWLKREASQQTWTLQKPAGGISETLDDLILARLDVLLRKNPSAYRLLNLASVSMTDRDWVSRAYLEAAYNGEGQSDTGRTAFENDLKSLIKGGYLAPRNSWSGSVDELFFLPAPLGSKAYEAMVEADRIPVHQRIYEFITQNMTVGQDYLEAQVLAASHAEKGQLFNESVNHYYAAIKYSRDLGLNAEPLSLIERAQPVLNHLPIETRNLIRFEWLTLAFDIHLKRANKDQAFQTLQSMSELVVDIDNPKHHLKYLDSQIFFREYYLTQDANWFDKIEVQAAIYLPHVDALSKAEWHNRLGYAYVYLEKLSKALEAFSLASLYAAKAGSDAEKAKSLHGMAIYYGHIGKLEESIDSAKESLKLFEKTGDKRKIAEVHMVLAAYLLDLKKYDECIEEAKLSIEISQSIGLVHPIIANYLNWCVALAAKGDFTGAITKADEALKQARESKLISVIAASLTYKSVYLSFADPAQAIELATEALSLSEQITPSYKASAHFALALSHAYVGEFKLAHKETLQALQIRGTLEHHKLESFDIELDELATVLINKGFEIPEDLYLNKKPESKLIASLIPQDDLQDALVPDELIENSALEENPVPQDLGNQVSLALAVNPLGLTTSALPQTLPGVSLTGK